MSATIAAKDCSLRPYLQWSGYATKEGCTHEGGYLFGTEVDWTLNNEGRFEAGVSKLRTRLIQLRCMECGQVAKVQSEWVEFQRCELPQERLHQEKDPSE